MKWRGRGPPQEGQILWVKKQCVGARFANGSRAGQAIGIETVDDGGTEVTIGT